MRDYPFAGQRIRLAPTTTIKSPSFRVSYPSIRNIECINAGPRSAMEVSWKREVFPERDIEIFDLRDVYFSEECLIFDDQLRVVENASDEYTDDEINRALLKIQALHNAGKLPHLTGPAIVSKRRAVNNYGHFLMEMLPMAIIGRDFLRGQTSEFLLHRLPPPMLDVMLRSARLLGIGMENLRIPDYGEPMHFQRLVIVRGLTAHGTYMSPLCPATVARLAEGVPASQHKKIYVKRAAGLQRGRALLNQDTISARLASHGYRMIDTAGMSLEEQISAFSGADQVVGVAGAAMSNIVFCRPGTTVVNVAPPDFADTFFWFIATHRRLRFCEIRGRQDGPRAFNPNANFWLDEPDIAWLANLESQDDLSPVEIAAHIHDVGDVHAGLGEWVGTPGSGLWIEGFSIDGRRSGTSLRYRAVLGPNWLSPWVTDQSFCGTRGFGLPLHGIVVDWLPEQPAKSDLLCNATFVDGTRKEGVHAGQPCVADSLAPLEAFQIVLRAKHSPSV